MSSAPDTPERARNRRGEGALLRDEIVAAAGTLLDRTGRDEAITLRAVAREVGIAAPSIYPHFADRDAIVTAVVEESFRDLSRAIAQATASAQGPIDRLRAGCHGYLAYTASAPHRYALLFSGPRPHRDAESTDVDAGAAAFNLLVDGIQKCVDAGLSASTDVVGDAIALWVGLHGYAALHAARPGFPWPEGPAVVERLITSSARITF